MSKSKATAGQLRARKQYLALMEEARVRLDAINHAFKNDAGLPPRMVREICYLQFRFLCEIIGLGCLVSHGGIKKTTSISKEYRPSKILKQMERLKPHFYPQRMEIKVVERVSSLIARPDLPHLSRADLGQLWSKAGSFLHRGKIVNLGKGEDIAKSLKPIERTSENFPDIFERSEKITGLLSCHWITLTDNKKGMFVTLRSPDTERVKASIFEFNTESKTVDVSSFKFGKLK